MLYKLLASAFGHMHRRQRFVFEPLPEHLRTWCKAPEDNQRHAFETPAFAVRCSLPDCHELRVSQGILVFLAGVPPSTDYRSVRVHNQRTNWYISIAFRSLGKFEGLLHPLRVTGVDWFHPGSLSTPRAFRARGTFKFRGTPERIRTSDLWFRRPPLYPAELRAHIGGEGGFEPSVALTTLA